MQPFHLGSPGMDPLAAMLQGVTIGYQMSGHLRLVIITGVPGGGECLCETSARPGASERSITTTRGRKISKIFRAFLFFFGDRDFTPKLVRWCFAREFKVRLGLLLLSGFRTRVSTGNVVRLQETVSMTRSFRRHKKRLEEGTKSRAHSSTQSQGHVIRGQSFSPSSRRPQSVLKFLPLARRGRRRSSVPR